MATELKCIHQIIYVDFLWTEIAIFIIPINAKAISITSTKLIGNSCRQRQFILSYVSIFSQIIHKTKYCEWPL